MSSITQPSSSLRVAKPVKDDGVTGRVVVLTTPIMRGTGTKIKSELSINKKKDKKNFLVNAAVFTRNSKKNLS